MSREQTIQTTRQSLTAVRMATEEQFSKIHSDDDLLDNCEQLTALLECARKLATKLHTLEASL